MRLQQYLIEKKVEMTGDQHKDHFLKLLNQWDSDLFKMTKAYKSLKSPSRMDFYEINSLGKMDIYSNIR